MDIAQRLHLHASTLSDRADSSEEAVATRECEQENTRAPPHHNLVSERFESSVVFEDARRGIRNIGETSDVRCVSGLQQGGTAN